MIPSEAQEHFEQSDRNVKCRWWSDAVPYLYRSLQSSDDSNSCSSSYDSREFEKRYVIKKNVYFMRSPSYNITDKKQSHRSVPVIKMYIGRGSVDALFFRIS